MRGVRPRTAARPLRIMHIALQGALRWNNVEYGITADTGGHIKYVLELVRASARNPRVGAIDLVVRAFSDDRFDRVYAAGIEAVAPKVRIVRIKGDTDRYLPKEDLWREHEALTRSLLAHIEAEGTPDLVHAHYADAGLLAANLKAERGVPFIFTAHSLGAVKRKAYQQSGRSPVDTDLDRRIAIENHAIGNADLVIASSRDEAELQYGDYDAHDPGRIRIVPPGIEREPFATANERDAHDLVSRFLLDPNKPAILAIARPVSKKNLAELVHAFGRSPSLRSKANLVLVAGNRNVLGEDESDRNLREILELIDRYDLYGSVAYPKTHTVEQMPALYRYAARTRGVFVNPALNEPFGLTLLEAAAAGLPVVATNRGGPNDIVGRIGHGTLVRPDRAGEIGRAIETLLSDHEAWTQASRNGLERGAIYDWDVHARRYLDLARLLVEPTRLSAEPAMPFTRMLATDIDGTLVGCARSLGEFDAWRLERPDMLYGVATGRSLHSALDVLEQEGAPLPSLMIVAVGAEIYWREPTGGRYRQDETWTRHIDEGWQRQSIDDLVMELPGFVRQPALEQRRHKLSYFVDETIGAECVERLREALIWNGLKASVVHSHGRFVDVLPERANKGSAVAWVAQTLGIPDAHVFVSGDSGNDIDMLRTIANPVIVANHRDGITALPELAHAYVAAGECAGGIMEGVEHYERISASIEARVQNPSPAAN